jgi:hypothetical protein
VFLAWSISDDGVNFYFQQVGNHDEDVDNLLSGIRRASLHGSGDENFPMVSPIRIAGDLGRLSLAIEPVPSTTVVAGKTSNKPLPERFCAWTSIEE